MLEVCNYFTCFFSLFIHHMCFLKCNHKLFHKYMNYHLFFHKEPPMNTCKVFLPILAHNILLYKESQIPSIKHFWKIFEITFVRAIFSYFDYFYWKVVQVATPHDTYSLEIISRMVCSYSTFLPNPFYILFLNDNVMYFESTIEKVTFKLNRNLPIMKA